MSFDWIKKIDIYIDYKLTVDLRRDPHDVHEIELLRISPSSWV